MFRFLAAVFILTALVFGALRSAPIPKQSDGPTITIRGLGRTIPADATRLNLSDTTMGDAGLKELAGLKNLTSLSLLRTKVTNAGLEGLAGLKQLTALSLDKNTLKT